MPNMGYGSVGVCKPGTSKTVRSPSGSQYSAKKPEACPVPVDFCLDCTRDECNFNAHYEAIKRWKQKKNDRH